MHASLMHKKHTLFTLSFSFIDIENVYQFINSEQWGYSPPGKAGVPGLFPIKIYIFEIFTRATPGSFLV